jgi:hypothetical protein
MKGLIGTGRRRSSVLPFPFLVSRRAFSGGTIAGSTSAISPFFERRPSAIGPALESPPSLLLRKVLRQRGSPPHQPHSNARVDLNVPTTETQCHFSLALRVRRHTRLPKLSSHPRITTVDRGARGRHHFADNQNARGLGRHPRCRETGRVNQLSPAHHGNLRRSCGRRRLWEAARDRPGYQQSA